MLPIDPLKIDLRRLVVVFSAAGAVAAPVGREVALSIRGNLLVVFVERAGALLEKG
jgi:hypothetical protein